MCFIGERDIFKLNYMPSDFIKSIKVIESEEIKQNADNYYKIKDYISASALKLIKKSPAHYIEAEPVETDAMIFGSAYHTFVLEPDKFEDRYYFMDDSAIYSTLIGEGSKSPRATKIYKDWVENQQRIANDKIILDASTMNILSGMRDRLLGNRFCASLLKNGEPEKSILCEIETSVGTNLKIKLRPDYLKADKKIIIDLKTTKDASKEEFPKSAANMDYHIQAALYCDIIEALTGKEQSFFFIAQEKVKPFAFNLFECSPQFISQGRYEWELLAMLWQYCYENNTWPGYQVWNESPYGINQLSLPSWAIREVNYYIHK